MPEYCHEALDQVQKIMKSKSFNRKASTVQKEFELATQNIKINLMETPATSDTPELEVNSMNAAKLIWEEENEPSE